MGNCVSGVGGRRKDSGVGLSQKSNTPGFGRGYC